jgi:hypothetical protein
VFLSVFATAEIAMKVGLTTHSMLVNDASFGASSLTNATDSSSVLYIFQLPAMIGVLIQNPL